MEKHPILLYNAQLVLSDRVAACGWLLLADGQIKAMGEGRPADGDLAGYAGSSIRRFNLDRLLVTPGFIDMHTHGAGGADFMDGTLAAWQTITRTHACHGTTTLLATTLTSTSDELNQTMQIWREWQGIKPDGPADRRGSTVLGLHLEGPYFSMEQRGAQDPRYLHAPDPAEYRPLIENNPGIRRWSAAPELPGALEFGDYAASRGILVSMAHTDALYEEVLAAIKHGYSLVTHLYSAMSSVRRIDGLRHGGVIESGLLLDDLDVEIIADGRHLPPELLQLIVHCKGRGKTALITDSMRAAGQDVQESLLGSLRDGQPVIIRDGVARLPDGSALAGSVATGDRLVRTMHQMAGFSLPDAVAMATETPARILGLKQQKGTLAVGRDADLAILSDDLQVRQTWIGGEMIYSR
ncbi:MAG: N-acetylglucosamine-6-phosphate deacetylase [Clostridiaceae bacterium]|nr:N-acetylglucosamine-6-phosphate deacetylase [Clostridiaceae bacterium]